MKINEMITTQDEKEMLVAGLVRVMYADGKLSDSEKLFFERVVAGLGLPQAVYENIEEYRNKPIKIQFANSRTNMYFLTQAVQVCYIDGSYDECEKTELLKICEEMGVTEEALKKVEDWVEEGIEWNNRGVELLDLK